jgi:hypothetical protein
MRKRAGTVGNLCQQRLNFVMGLVADRVDLWLESLPRERRILVEQGLNSVMVLPYGQKSQTL